MHSLKMSSRRSWITLSVAVLLIALIVGVSAGTVFGSVHSSFDHEVNVAKNAAGIDVSWVSADGEDGHVEYATSAKDLSARSGSFGTAYDDRGAYPGRVNKRSHRASVQGIPGGSTIYYQIISGGVIAGPFEVTIPSVALTTPPNLLTGNITYAGGAAGRECLVSMRVSYIDATVPQYSMWVNALSNNTTGGYTLDITNIRQDPNNLYAPYTDPDSALTYPANSANAKIYVRARCDADNFGSTEVTTLAASKIPGGGYQNVNVQVIPPPTLTINDVTVNEDAGTATLTVTMNPTASGTVTVAWQTTNSTAISGTDYQAGTNTLSFAASESTKTITVYIFNDTRDENTENFNVVLSGTTGDALISDATGVVTINDNDGPPTINVQGTDQVTEVDAPNTSQVGITAALSEASDYDVTIDYATADGTALAGADYTAKTGTMIITAGQTTGTVNITVIGDSLLENNETFLVNWTNGLSHGDAATITGSPTTVTILAVPSTPTQTPIAATPSITPTNTTVSVNTSATRSPTAPMTQTPMSIIATPSPVPTPGQPQVHYSATPSSIRSPIPNTPTVVTGLSIPTKVPTPLPNNQAPGNGDSTNIAAITVWAIGLIFMFFRLLF